MKKPRTIAEKLNNKVKKRNDAEKISKQLKTQIEKFLKTKGDAKKLELAQKITNLKNEAQKIAKDIGTNIGSSNAKKYYDEVKSKVIEVLSAADLAAAEAEFDAGVAQAKAAAEAEKKVEAEKPAAEAEEKVEAEESAESEEEAAAEAGEKVEAEESAESEEEAAAEAGEKVEAEESAESEEEAATEEETVTNDAADKSENYKDADEAAANTAFNEAIKAGKSPAQAFGAQFEPMTEVHDKKFFVGKTLENATLTLAAALENCTEALEADALNRALDIVSAVKTNSSAEAINTAIDEIIAIIKTGDSAEDAAQFKEAIAEGIAIVKTFEKAIIDNFAAGKATSFTEAGAKYDAISESLTGFEARVNAIVTKYCSETNVTANEALVDDTIELVSPHADL